MLNKVNALPMYLTLVLLMGCHENAVSAAESSKPNSANSSAPSVNDPKFEIKFDKDPRLCAAVKSALELHPSILHNMISKRNDYSKAGDITFDNLPGAIKWEKGNRPAELENSYALRWSLVDINRDGKMEYVTDDAWDTSDCCLGSNFSVLPLEKSIGLLSYSHRSTKLLHKDGLSDEVNAAMDNRVVSDYARPILGSGLSEEKPRLILTKDSNYRKIFGFEGDYYLYMTGESKYKLTSNPNGSSKEETPPYNQWILILKFNDWWFLPAYIDPNSAPDFGLSKMSIDPVTKIRNDEVLEANPVCGLKKYIQ